MILSGSDIIVECLLNEGADTVFGYPGGAVLNIYDSIYKYSDKIRHIITSHEQGACHAADGYARATGKTGVAFGLIECRKGGRINGRQNCKRNCRILLCI